MEDHTTMAGRSSDSRTLLLPAEALGLLQLPPEFSFIVSHGEGAWLYDTRGNRYLDYVLGSGPLILGHADPRIVAAVTEAVRRGSTYYYVNEPALGLAEAIVGAVASAEQVRFMSTGSEATYLSIRLARAFTGRNRILKFEGGFHGFYDLAMIGLAPREPTRYPRGTADSLGVTPSTLEEVLVAPYNNVDAVRSIATSNGDDLAAIIVEPIQRDYSPHPGFLESLRSIADDLGALLIFDEVVTGFRLTYGGVQDLHGVVPDLTALGKIIGGGYPLSAIAGRADIMELCDQSLPNGWVYVSGTLSGNPVAASAGLATLGVLNSEDSYDKLHHIGNSFRDGLRSLLAEASVRAFVAGEGPTVNIYFGVDEVHDHRTAEAADTNMVRAFAYHMLSAGIFVNPGKKMYLSTAHTQEQIDFTLEVASDALGAIMRNGI